MMFFNDLDGRLIRERLDMMQLFESWVEAEHLRKHSFAGSLTWELRGSKDYLYSRKRGVVKSLGNRNKETEKIFDAFHRGRKENVKRLEELSTRINRQAAVLRAMRPGRLPFPAAKVLRALAVAAPNSGLRVVGTNALFAYESMAAVSFDDSSTATGDIDFLVDHRKRLRLTGESANIGLIGLIQKEAGRSFLTRNKMDFRLTNKEGYMIEFIRPETRSVHRKMPGDKPPLEGDVIPAPIQGLQWLVNAPFIDTIVIDERGYAAPMRVPDPRIWAFHKLWLSQQTDRKRDKSLRDSEQAHLVKDLVIQKMPHLPFDDDFLSTLPGPLKQAGTSLLREAPLEQRFSTPDW